MKNLSLLFVLFFVYSLIAFAQDTTLSVTSDGNVGIGTSSPLEKLHVEGSIFLNSALGALRINHSGTNDGWRVAAIGGGQNLTFISDPAGGGETNRVTFAQDGNVGIGTTNPGTKFDVTSTSTTEEYKLARFSSDPDQGDFNYIEVGRTSTTDGTKFGYLHHWASSMSGAFIGDSPFIGLFVNHTGYVGIGTIAPNHPLEMGSGAHVTVGGVWTNASSREFMENIQELKLDEAIETLSGLVPVKFNYKADKDEEYVGFIADEVPELVATNDRKGLSHMDIIAVLTKVVQEQQKKIEELETRLYTGY